MMPRLTYDPGEQAVTPGNRYTYTIFIYSNLIYGLQSKWGGGAQSIFSFSDKTFYKMIEKHSYMQ